MDIIDIESGRNLAAALKYAVRGWQSFPLKHRSKEPATRGGFYDGTANPARLRRWFGSGYHYNIAVRTGVASRLVVVDVDDDRGGADTLAELEAEHGALPDTLVSFTGRGRHSWFYLDAELPSSVDRIGPGIDIRADGGYVVAPPSTHPNGRIYHWRDAAVPLATAPGWLLWLARRKPPPRISERATSSMRPPGAGTSGYGRAALKAEVAALASTPQGSRNIALNRASFSLHQLVAGGELDGGEVEQRLVAAADANGLLADDGMRQVLATIRSGARAGLLNPRGRP
jgi:hypothetical protein